MNDGASLRVRCLRCERVLDLYCCHACGGQIELLQTSGNESVPGGELRRYYARAVDERTGAPCLDTMIEAANPDDALAEAHREACFRAGHLAVRVTSLAEQSVDAAGATAKQLIAERMVG